MSKSVFIATDKALFFIRKCLYLSYFSTKTYVVCIYSLEAPRRGASWRNKKNIMLIKAAASNLGLYCLLKLICPNT